MAEENGHYDWDKHGEEHERIWKSIAALREVCETLRIISQNTLNTVTELHLAAESVRDRILVLTVSVASLVEAVKSNLEDSKALRARHEKKDDDSRQWHDELMGAHNDLMTELRLARAENRDLYAVGRALDRPPASGMTDKRERQALISQRIDELCASIHEFCVHWDAEHKAKTLAAVDAALSEMRDS